MKKIFVILAFALGTMITSDAIAYSFSNSSTEIRHEEPVKKKKKKKAKKECCKSKDQAAAKNCSSKGKSSCCSKKTSETPEKGAKPEPAN